MLSLTPGVLAAAGIALLVGALVQGSVGIGLGLVAAPVMALVDPSLVPGTILLVTGLYPLLTATRELHDVDWLGLRWALLGRVPGAAIGALAVATLSARALDLAVALCVLGAVAVSLSPWRPQPTPRALLVGGTLGGVTGTATSIGGPPVAILYQYADGARLRSTLAAYFVGGALISGCALLVTGQLGAREVGRALVLLPFLIAGFLLSGPLRRFVDRGWTRPAVLGLCAASALVLGVRTLVAL